MVSYSWIAVVSAAVSLLSQQVGAVPAGAAVPRQEEDQASIFVDELIANLTQAAEETQARKRGLFSCSQKSSRTVNLGYAKYQGYHDDATDLNIWKGIRYAVPPTGNLRWQPPLMPALNLAAGVTPANEFGPTCPQNLPSSPGVPLIPGNEDCLFLNVYAPPNAKNLPVMVWIHPGGYGFGDGLQDMSTIINDNNKEFIAVTIQYRLNAFGFLASPDVKSNGAVNAGLLDQALALAWVKLFICQFGGDPTSVTIAGESAGASSVMYHGLAVGGNLGSLLFNNGIAASPYLPFQYDYAADFNVDRYNALAGMVGCGDAADKLQCLREADSMALQQASHDLTQQQPYGFWTFYPVTDNAYITSRAAKQLGQKKVNGKRMLVGHVANEAPLFVPLDIVTESDLVNWLEQEFENLTPAQIQSILDANPNSADTDLSAPLYETNGLTGATSYEVSQDANGQRQRGNNILAESTFVCPSYWMADAWSGSSKKAWHFQYSVPLATHAVDVATYFGPTPENVGEEMAFAVRRMWGNMITGGNPSISNTIANGASSPNPSAPNGASSWPVWTPSSPQQINLNQTGGTPYDFTTAWGRVVTQFQGPGLLNDISVVPADTWEGGRGQRCDFWKGLTPHIPA